MQRPVIPESLSGLTIEQLTELIAKVRAFAQAIAANLRAGEDVDPEDKAFALAAPAEIDRLKAQVTELEALDAIDGLADDDGDDEDESEDEDEDDDPDPDAEASETEDAAGDDAAEATEGDETEDEPDTVTASARRRRRRGAGALAETEGNDAAPPGSPDALAQSFTALGGVDGYEPGQKVATMVELGQMLVKRFEDIRGGGTEKLGVAQIHGRFSEDQEMEPGRVLGWDPYGGPDSIRAGMDCVPREPIYDVGCASSTERPFANSLPNMRAPRGGYIVPTSPTLASVQDADEVGDGTGIWTRDDDGDLDAVKNACAVIPCGDSENFDIYGVYRCLTVRNLLQMTWPELVAAFLNKLGALWARLAERTLLDGMVNSPWAIDVTDAAPEDLGATASLLDSLLQATAVYTEQERFGDGLQFGVWLHRWVAVLLIRDWLKAPRYNPSMAELVAARAEVNTAFARAGYNVHWVIDNASDWPGIATQGNGVLRGLPRRAHMHIAPEGKFRRLDEGVMTVGVTNRNPWDKDDMARNQFTMFWESYEGIIDLGGCPSWNLRVDGLCPNGLINYEPQAAPECPDSGSGS